MPAYNFNAQFADAVESGKKRQTIRATRKDGYVPKKGDPIYCYTNMRRKGCRLLMMGAVTRVTSVTIYRTKLMYISDRIALGKRSGWLSDAELRRLALADGFNSVDEFISWFTTPSKDVFEGHLIRWTPFPAVTKIKRMMK